MKNTYRDKWWIIDKLAEYQLFNKYVLRWILELIELSLIAASIPLAWIFLKKVGFGLPLGNAVNMQQSLIYGFFLIVLWLSISQVASMARPPRSQRFLDMIFLFTRGFFFIFFLQILIKYLIDLEDIPLTFIIVNIGIAFFLTLGFRILSVYFVRIYRASGHNLRRVLVIGDVSAGIIIDRFQYQKDWGYEILAIVSKSRVLKQKYEQDYPVLPGIENLESILVNQVIDEIFYCQETIDKAEVRRILKICDEIGVIFRLYAGCNPMSTEPLEVKTLTKNKNLALVDLPAHSIAFEIKHVFDFIFSLSFLVLSSPILALVALIIKLESRGPVFYRQERIGLRGRKFGLWKFRTMVINAEAMQERLQALNEADGPVFKIKNDPRVTRFGRILRKTGIDEIPQLINVLRGEMSLIGPRPPIESEVRQYKPNQLRRLSVKPGITCTWQIQPDRNDILFDHWVDMDLNYIDNWSLIRDFKLMFKTIAAMLDAGGR